MRRAAIACGVMVAGLWTTGVGVVATAAQEGTPRSVYVSVLDENGQQVPGLTADDFTLTEDGKPYDVTVSLPSERIRLAVVIEELLAPDTGLRMGVYELARRMLPQADISLIVVSNRAETTVDYTRDGNTLVQGLNDLTIRNVREAGNLTEGIYEVAQDIEEAAPPRSALVIIALEMLQSSAMRADRVLDQLRKSGAAVHTVTLDVPQSAASSAGMQVDMAYRNQVLAEAPKQSGGLRLQLIDLKGTEAAMGRVADVLSAQYELTYTLPPGVNPNRRVEVTVDRQGATLYAPSRIQD